MTPDPVRAKLSERIALCRWSLHRQTEEHYLITATDLAELEALEQRLAAAEAIQREQEQLVFEVGAITCRHGVVHPMRVDDCMYCLLAARDERLAAAEGLAEGWRKQANDMPGHDAWCVGRRASHRLCADELSAIVKGEGK